MLVLRFSHVFFGALWVGMMAFQTFFLMPALAEVGPDSGKLMAALMRRRIPVTGQHGRNAAIAILQDDGKSLEQVLGKPLRGP